MGRGSVSELTWTPDIATLGELELWDANPKRMSKARAERLLRSWEEMGQYQTLAIGPGGEVFDGHQRIRTLQAAGYGPDYEVRVLRSSRVLTEQERRRVVAESTVGTIGALDWDQLASWDYGELADWGFDDEALAGWNDDAANLALMREAEEDEPSEQDGDPVDIPEQWMILIECRNENEQAELLERFYEEGLECRALIS